MMGVNGGELPSFLQVDNSSYTKNENGSYACPNLRGIGDEYLKIIIIVII